MAQWFRRKRKKSTTAPESESTGRVGQPKAPGQSALQPSYLESSQPQESPQTAPRQATLKSAAGQALRETARRVRVETQPESPATPPAVAAQATGTAQHSPRGVVVLAIGLPGSGKTTWFKRRGVTPLSSDILRSLLFDDITEQRHQSLVFSTLRSLLRARLVARMPWNYVDATNLSPKERRQWIQMARSLGYEVHAVFFDVPLDVCLERNRRRERIVPEDIMRRMAAKLRPPTFDEGFAKILVVKVKAGAGEADSSTSSERGAAHSDRGRHSHGQPGFEDGGWGE